ncbi:unnamed protein product (macronuclear) [Paramecium tetraurelia]|uniref:BZIP domain-containing protein n=1 Tax=Paramecium tetraurelia TaxID=5888 RepID=A0DN19_PARTE|nr:uncharacterized protein GSPATT00018641001 [Paramecium tetraurelia]CAK84436.1 unnamed protein product [Paramecium tetraurelia]|eukprot:XP_001451833.1 hypothetical protein (macronuclear) [Paramecium tetraurelia strain d4-2]
MDQYQNAFQMLGQNMFSKAPPSGYAPGYHPMIQANSNKQNQCNFRSRQYQKMLKKVSDYNTRMKGKEDYIYELEQQSMQLQRDLVQKDKYRNEHNQIHYKNYQPTFNVQNTLPMESLQTDLQSVQNQNPNTQILPGDNPEVQPQQVQRRTSVQLNQTRPQSFAIQGNQKLINMQKQMEEQNQYIQQLSALVAKKKPAIDSEKDDSLTQLLNERDDLQKQHILNEIKQLKQRVDEFDLPRQQMIPQQFQQHGFMPQQQQMQQQGMMQFQNPYGMYPQMYPPNIQQQQQQSDELDDNDLNNEILMKLLDQQNRQKKRGSRNGQKSHDYNHRNSSRDRRHTQKRKQQDDDQDQDGDSN